MVLSIHQHSLFFNEEDSFQKCDKIQQIQVFTSLNEKIIFTQQSQQIMIYAAISKQNNQYLKIHKYDYPKIFSKIKTLKTLQTVVNSFRWQLKVLKNNDIKVYALQNLKGGMQKQQNDQQLRNSKSSSSSSQFEELSHKIMKKLPKLLTKKNEIKNFTETIFVMGNTGAGKSSMINYLIGKKMKIIKNEHEYIVEPDQKQAQNPEVGHGFQSKTNTLKIFHDKKNDFYYYDTPGFDETKGVQFDIANAILIQQGFQKTKKSKLLLTINSQSWASDRGNGIFATLQKFYDMFPKVSQFKESIAIIFCRAKQSAEINKQKLTKLIEQRSKSLQDKQFKQFLKQILNFPMFAFSHAQIFQRGDKKCIQIILNGIHNLKYAINLKIHSIPLSDNTKYQIQKIISESQRTINHQMNEVVPLQIEKICQKTQNQIELYKLLANAWSNAQTIQIIFSLIKDKKLNQVSQMLVILEHFLSYFKIQSAIIGAIEILVFYYKIFLSKHQEEKLMINVPFQAAIQKITVALDKIIDQQCKKKQVILDQGWKKYIQKRLNQSVQKFNYSKYKQISLKISKLLEEKDEQFLKKVPVCKIFQFEQNLLQMCKLVIDLNDGETLSNYKIKDKQSDIKKNTQSIYSFMKRNKTLFGAFATILRRFYLSKDKQLARLLDYDEKQKKHITKIRQQNLKKVITSNGQITQNRNAVTVKQHILQLGLFKSNIQRHANQLYQKQMHQGAKQQIQLMNGFVGLLSLGGVIKGNLPLDLLKVNRFRKQNYLDIGYYCYLYAAQEMVFNETLQFFGNLIIVSPKIIIKKNKYGQSPSIIIKGFNSPQVSPSYLGNKVATKDCFDKYDSSNVLLKGKDGNPGIDGFPGGILTIITKQIINPELLTVNISGGDGSNGQNGQDGAPCEYSWFFSPKKGNGGNGGNGGDAGAAGQPGFVQCYNEKGQLVENKFNIIKNIGNQGKPGNPGKGGRKWKDKAGYKDGQPGNIGKYRTKNILKYSSQVISQCSYQLAKKQYSQFIYTKYKDTDFESFLDV